METSDVEKGSPEATDTRGETEPSDVEEGSPEAADTGGETETSDVEEGSPVAGALEAKIATLEDVDGENASDCAFLACFLAAAFVCQPHEHCLFVEGEKNDPCRHFWTSLFEGFCPLPVRAGRSSARSISCSAYCSIPQK